MFNKMPFRNIFQKIQSFLKEVFTELKKVSWPTRQEILKYTLIVIVTVLLAGMFLGVTDFLFTTFLNRFIL